MQTVARPDTGPPAQQCVPELLVGTVIREIAPREHRVEAFVDCHAHELVEHGEVVLTVGVDREHQVVRRELAGLEPVAQGRERKDVRLRHALVHVVPQQPAAIVSRQPGLDRGIDDVGLGIHEMRGQPVGTALPDFLRAFREEGVGRHFDCVGLHGPLAERLAVRDRVRVNDEHHRAGAIAALDGGLHRGVDLGELRLVDLRSEGGGLAAKKHKKHKRKPRPKGN